MKAKENILALYPNVVRDGMNEPSQLLGALYVPGRGVIRNMRFCTNQDGVLLKELHVGCGLSREESNMIGDWKGARLWLQSTSNNSSVGELVFATCASLDPFYADLVNRTKVPAYCYELREVTNVLEACASKHCLLQGLCNEWMGYQAAHWILAKHFLCTRT